jgi:hypothetical protein
MERRSASWRPPSHHLLASQGAAGRTGRSVETWRCWSRRRATGRWGRTPIPAAGATELSADRVAWPTGCSSRSRKPCRMRRNDLAEVARMGVRLMSRPPAASSRRDHFIMDEADGVRILSWPGDDRIDSIPRAPSTRACGRVRAPGPLQPRPGLFPLEKPCADDVVTAASSDW